MCVPMCKGNVIDVMCRICYNTCISCWRLKGIRNEIYNMTTSNEHSNKLKNKFRNKLTNEEN